MNDLAAVGALAALEAGVTVPAELAVTGYDDTFFSAIPQVSLTTVNPDNATIRTTASACCARRPGAEGGSELIPPRLVVRATTPATTGGNRCLTRTCWRPAGRPRMQLQDERSPIPLRERVESAAAAGFRGIGLLHVDLVVAEREHGPAGIRSLLDDNGLVHLELELLTDWWADGPRRRRSDEVRRKLLEAAGALWRTPRQGRARRQRRTLGPRPVGGGVRAGRGRPPGRDQGRAGVPSWSNIRTVHDGLRLVGEAGHDAGGLIIDA